MRPSIRVVQLVIMLSLTAPRTSGAHPLHTSLTRITLGPNGSLTVAIRTFSDDFSAAVSRTTRAAATADHRVPDAAVVEYLERALTVLIEGRRIELRLTSQRRESDVTWIELRGQCSGSLAGATIMNRLLMELHKDQVNIVQATYGGVSRTMLFSGGDAFKSVR